MGSENLLRTIILSCLSLFVCVYSSQVPARIKHPSTCQYKDFFRFHFFCDKWANDTNTIATNKCIPFQPINSNQPIFLLYDVNSVEGFNLRRDVYIRMAVFVKTLRQRPNYLNSFLVLPPFYQLYHWNLVTTNRYRTNNVIGNDIVFWNHFFDLESMKQYTGVLDFWEYLEIMRDCFKSKHQSTLDYVFQLKHFESMFQSRKFEEKFEIQSNCDKNSMKNRGQFISLYSNFSINHIDCVEFQGSAALLFNLLEKFTNSSDGKTKSIVLLNAETVLHDYWGGTEYWMVRRSMRFNSYLVNVANVFRKEILNSTDAFDGTERPNDWRNEKAQRTTKGGNYLCAHLRRADFLHGREETTPSLRSAATQILHKLKELQLKTVFISSDCTGQEYHSFKSFLTRYRVIKFQPSSVEERERLKPGGIAVVDQIICSHARFFIGTYESTFTYRIYEEREIMGFSTESTFNTFCKTPHETDKCSRNSVWPIVY